MARNLDLSVRLKAAVDGLNEVSALISEIQDLGGATEESASRSRALSAEIRELEKADNLVSSFRNLKQEVASTSTELDKAQQESQRLGRELANSSKPTKTLERDFEKARKTVNRLKDTQQQQVRSLQKQRQELGKAGIDSRKLSDAQRKIRASMAGTSSQVDKLTSDLKQARDQSAKQFKDPTDRLERGARTSGRAVDGLGTRLKRVAGIAVASVASFVGIREAIRGVTGIARVGGEFEILQKRLEALTGSAEAGEEAFAWIQDFTKNTPFQLDQVTDAFIKAKAFGLDPMDGTLQAVADQASKTGGGFEALSGIVGALGKSFSKNKLQAEEMIQLVERGVPAYDLLANATGKTTEELMKLGEQGKLGRREIALLIKELGRSSEGAAQSQMQTLQGLISNLRDTWTQFLVDINDQGLMEYLKNQIREIADAFKDMRESGELQQWARRISDAIIGLIEALKTVASTLFEYRDAIIATAKAWAIYKAAQAAVGISNFARLIRAQAVTAMADLGAQTAATTGRMSKLGAVLRALPGPVKIIALAASFLGVQKAAELAGDAVATYIRKYSEGARVLEENEAKIAQIARDRIEALKEETEQLEQFRQVRQVSAEEALKLSDQEREAAEQRLQGLRDLLENESKQLEFFKILGYDVADSMAAIGDSLDETVASLQNLTSASDQSGRAIENGISAAAQQLVDNFEAMISSGEDAAKATESLFDSFDSNSVSSVRQLVEAIRAISEESEAAGKAIETELKDRLDSMTGQELRRFSVTLAGAFEGGTVAAGRFKDLADEIADAALQNIGTSLQEIRTGISLMESEALQSFQAFTDSGKRSADEVKEAVEALQSKISSPEAVDQLRRLLDTWGEQSGEKIDEVEKALNTLAQNVKGTAEQLAEELKGAIESAGDEQALEEVGRRIRKLWNEGKIGAEEYTTALAQVRDRQRELNKETEEGAEKAKQKLKEVSDQAKETADSAEEIRNKFRSAWGDAFGQALTNAREQVTALSTAARNLFELKIGGNAFVNEAETASEALERTERRVDELNRARARLMNNSFGAWFADTAIAAAEVERQFHAQAAAMENLQERIESGGFSLRQLDSIAGSAADKFDLLDDQRLSQLQSAIDTTRAKVQQLTDSLTDTVSSLRQELASLEGDTVELEKLRYQEQRLELEQQLQKARELGDQQAISAAQEALNLQRQAYDLRVKNAREQEEEDRRRAAERAAEAERQRQEQERQQREREAADFSREERNADRQAAAQQPSRTIVLQSPTGRQASVSVSDEDEGDLLGVLEDLGYRSNG